MTCVPGLIEISLISCYCQVTLHGNRLESSSKHVVMSFMNEDVSNVKDFESFEIGLRICSEKQGTAEEFQYLFNELGRSELHTGKAVAAAGGCH